MKAKIFRSSVTTEMLSVENISAPHPDKEETIRKAGDTLGTWVYHHCAWPFAEGVIQALCYGYRTTSNKYESPKSAPFWGYSFCEHCVRRFTCYTTEKINEETS
jgi:hypothetical protein